MNLLSEFRSNSEYEKKLHAEWLKLLRNEPVSTDIVRPEILEAWNECMRNKVDPDNANFFAIDKNVYNNLLNENKLLCSIAEPFMHTIFDNIPGSASNVTLVDSNGIILKQLSNPKSNIYDNYIHIHGILPGMTGSMKYKPAFIEVYLCQKYQKPAYCFGEENFFSFSKNWMCVAAPIFDETNTLIGSLTISDTKSNYDQQSMGLAIATAKAISNEITMCKLNDALTVRSNQLSNAIELVPEGFVLLSSDGFIEHTNSYFRKIMFLNENVIGKHISELLKDENDYFKNNKLTPTTEREIALNTQKGIKHYHITIKRLSSEKSDTHNNGWFIILKDSEYTRKLSNSVNASFSKFDFSNIICHDKKTLDVIEIAKIAARSSSTVLITGASGTGKELFAHAIHSASDRKNNPFISINCGALPANLVESELFGYEGGAFTGSKKEGQVGKFELADKGTIFLDEIGEMPLAAQASILKVIESKEVTRIGGNKPMNVDIRIIAATNVNLEEAIEDKTFREDLYYRLNVLRIQIPRLCDRKADISPLIDKFLDIYQNNLNKYNVSLSTEARSAMLEYSWPGNVRELENTIERIVNICDNNTELSLDQLGIYINLDTTHKSTTKNSSVSEKNSFESTTIHNAEKELIIKALEDTEGSIVKTSQRVGLGRRTLYRKCEEYNIDYNSFRK